MTVTDTGAVIPPSTLTGGADPYQVNLGLGEDHDALEGLRQFHRAAIAEALTLEILRSVKGILKARAPAM